MADSGVQRDDPFSVLGMHRTKDGMVVRAFVPWAAELAVVKRKGAFVAALQRIDADGVFAGPVPGKKPFRYRLRATAFDGSVFDFDDPYRFGTILGQVDTYLIAEGTHRGLHERLGAHAATLDDVAGTVFAVWAPNALRVAVVGDFNDWDGRRHALRYRAESGVWEIFLPHVGEGARYKYEIHGPSGALLPLKADPFAFASEMRPATASIVAHPGKDRWRDGAWMRERAARNRRDAPISIYEVHLGSWRRGSGNRYLTYGELAEQLVPYARDMGFTHIELLPVAEHPFDGSWGYQTIGLFAPTSRFGSPQEFAEFVDRAHDAGLGVIADWVPGHFPTDEHGLARFDGTALYEHEDPRQGWQPGWQTLVYNFGRREVANFLIDNALFWLDEYHVDGLRVDAVASMIYLDFGREPGQWIANEHGGNENLAAVAFLQRTNELAYGSQPAIATYAEESSTWPNVTHPVSDGGLGFGYKWNMGWMHDTLDYMSEDPVFRKHHHAKITFGITYAWTENFVLPLSHDEVVHLKHSIIGRMPGDEWQRFANLRAYYGLMWTWPGKKLLFMGGEFAQEHEWDHDHSLDWHLLDDPKRRGVQAFVRDLNALYVAEAALHELDCEPAGFAWIDPDNAEQSIFSYTRSARDGRHAVVVANFTPVVRHGFRLGVPEECAYLEMLNSDDEKYGGSGVRNGAPLVAEAVAAGRMPYSVVLTVPPLATVVLVPQRAQ